MRHCCEQMAMVVAEADLPLTFNRKLREYGIEWQDGGTSRQTIGYCPWCGSRLPESLRDRWFSDLRAMGLVPSDDSIPDDYRTEMWWVKKGL